MVLADRKATSKATSTTMVGNKTSEVAATIMVGVATTSTKTNNSTLIIQAVIKTTMAEEATTTIATTATIINSVAVKTAMTTITTMVMATMITEMEMIIKETLWEADIRTCTIKEDTKEAIDSKTLQDTATKTREAEVIISSPTTWVAIREVRGKEDTSSTRQDNNSNTMMESALMEAGPNRCHQGSKTCMVGRTLEEGTAVRWAIRVAPTIIEGSSTIREAITATTINTTEVALATWDINKEVIINKMAVWDKKRELPNA